ncbi:TIGR02530 family flagellar biosynthesis protein [Oceanobacillus halophilus]|uniref:Flagellar protein n=1 Tax=Oceanobacillus halophilus TaxID=930130 RepID=A0A495ABW0_9BACI|nr:TIGR02530 family flagellar biosynthesis protein [Oceanobacillus halophilus]RKQ37489.1 flagellar protein [Oceanobacillus halophilus]
MSQPIQQVAQQYSLQLPRDKNVTKNDKSIAFKDLLAEQSKLKISKHATSRLNERNIEINEKQWQTIEEKMQEAKKKGITDSLVVLNEAALLVSAKNNTVVTAMDINEASSKIFTNINGTILINE